MSVLHLLAGRYLLGLRRRTHVAAVSAISFGAMALGAAALVITLALLEGFQATIRDQLVAAGVHAEILPRTGSTLPPGDWLARLRAARPDLQVRVLGGGMVWCMSGDAAVPAELEAVDTLTRVEINRILAARLGIGAGFELTIVSSHLLLTPLGPVPARRQVLVAAVSAARPGDERARVLVPTAIGAPLLGSSSPRAIELRASDPAAAWDVASRVQGLVPEGVRVVSFRELNRPLLAALALERTMIGLGVALVMVVAALNLLCNLALLAAEKRADVALLAALGLTPARIHRLFMVLGLGVGVLGGLLGTLGGGLISFLLDHFHVVPLERGVFIVSHVPFRVTAEALGIVLAISLAASLITSLAPARAASRRDVLEGLRYE